jgi:MoaA/NifB/PqqE/SkfB family radical SAM enzyme
MLPKSPNIIDNQFCLVIDVTYRCNGNCVYCQWTSQQNNKRFDEPDSNVLIPKNSLENLGVQRVVFSGGEPLLRKDLELIISYYANLGIESIIIITNGLLLSEKRLNSLLNAGLTGVTFSIDGISEEIALKTRGLNEKQQKLILYNLKNTLHRRKHDNIEIGINTVISGANLNIEVLRDLVDFCNKSSIDWLKFNPLFDDGFVSKNAPWLLFDQKDVSKINQAGKTVVENCNVQTNHIGFWNAMASVHDGRYLDPRSCGLEKRQALAIRGEIKFCFWNDQSTYGSTSSELNAKDIKKSRELFRKSQRLCKTGTYCFCLQNFNHLWRITDDYD